MATRSEQYRANEQRRAAKRSPRAERSKPGVASKNRSRAKARVAKKAPYALEANGAGTRPSRKSSRKSENRAKTDTSFNLVEEMRKGSPEARFAKAHAKAIRVRGKRGSR